MADHRKAQARHGVSYMVATQCDVQEAAKEAGIGNAALRRAADQAEVVTLELHLTSEEFAAVRTQRWATEAGRRALARLHQACRRRVLPG